MRAVRNVFPSARFVVFSTLEEVYMKTNRTKRSVLFITIFEYIIIINNDIFTDGRSTGFL